MRFHSAQDSFNCASRLQAPLREFGGKAAFWSPKLGSVSFSEFGALCAKAQKGARVLGLKPGSPVLILARPCPELYASIFALIGMRIPVMFLEPWLPVEQISSVLQKSAPQAVLVESGVGGWLARLWSLKLGSGDFGKNCQWISLAKLLRERTQDEPIFEDGPATDLAIMAFSSGSKSAPKGVIRSHLALWNAHEVIRDCATRWQIDDSAPDLCVFPNLPLYNISEARTSLLLLDHWTSPDRLRRWKDIPEIVRPSSIACGPAVLRALLDSDAFPTLHSIKLGGAQTDCAVVEQSFKKWADVRIHHVYGSSEAEPISIADAREALKLCAERDAFQLTYIGRPISEIEPRIDESVLWIRGPHVFSNESGSWWCTDDRIAESPTGWWYRGRGFQKSGDFELEQRIYSFLRGSHSFIHRGADSSAHLVGEVPKERTQDLLKTFPEIAAVHQASLVWDRRHRARIDRTRSLPKELRQERTS